jgi:hypothetical protein
MGIIARWNQTLDDVHTKIQSLNDEFIFTMDLLEQQKNFDQIQDVDNDLNFVFEAQWVAKKELWDFQPIF